MTHPDREGSWRPYPPPAEEQPSPQQPTPEQLSQQQSSPELPPPPVFPPPAVARAQVRPPQLPAPPQYPQAQAAYPQASYLPAQNPQASYPQEQDPQASYQQAQYPQAQYAQVAPVQPAPQAVPVAPRQQTQHQQVADATGRGLAAPQLTSAPLAGPQGRALAAAQAAQGQNENPPDEPSDGDDEARTGPSGKTSPLHIGWHAISRKTLRRVTVAPSAGAGLVLGRDRQHAPVPLHLFAPEPVRIALVGGVWAAQLLIFRAFALGARVVVVTTEPRAWAGFGERATGQYNRLTVHSSDQGAALTGSAQMPTLVVYDLGMTGPATTPPLGPWSTQLTILRQLDRPGLAALQESQLALLQRLGGDEAALAASALKLRPHSSQFLQFMADDMLALIGDGTDRYLFLGQTQTEQQFVGLPRR
ncbi:hypothetical protein Acy02nite_10450 [Actinoplanes cyaneus]|uniref:Uncharacterized protein n=1 Tax=Actinoplanes cyaneus TaxID=52696 RepID=A0A919ICS0_9ACTN|nr:hypothetical protein [Actinoplanes cyaneus]MCW2137113.1 hypothetical protein [Actinoplanes cyaneus]GID63164.1 hypothetical protein Acy02nite_10450 [Actinoplanes cyaneus]